MSQLNKDLANGTLWTVLTRYTGQIFNIIIGAILSRLLLPEEFGIVAMVIVFTGFFAIFNDAGIKSFIIQYPNLSREDQSFVFFIGVLIGGFISAILYIGAPYIEEFYDLKGLASVTKVCSFQFIITSLSFVPRGIIERNLQFKLIGLIELVVSAAGGILGVILALLSFSYWALIISNLFTFMGIAILVFIFSKWRPSLKINKVQAKQFIRYSGNLTLFGIINYWARNLDNLIIGKYLGSAPLGFYNRAYNLMTYPIAIFSSVINPILHPVFSKVQTNVDEIRTNYLNILKILSLISFPLMAFLTINAESVISIIWGGQWKNSVPVFRVLGIASLFQPILNTTGSIYLVRNKTNWLFRVGLVNTTFMIISFIIGMRYGILGVATGYMITFMIMLIPMMHIVFNKLLNGSVWEFIKKISTAFYLAVFIGISNVSVLLLVKNLYINSVLNLFISLIIVFLSIRTFEPEIFLNIKRFIKKTAIKFAVVNAD